MEGRRGCCSGKVLRYQDVVQSAEWLRYKNTHIYVILNYVKTMNDRINVRKSLVAFILSVYGKAHHHQFVTKSE